MNSYNFIYGEENLPHRAKAVYIYLRGRSNKEGVCWPGIKTLLGNLSCLPEQYREQYAILKKRDSWLVNTDIGKMGV